MRKNAVKTGGLAISKNKETARSKNKPIKISAWKPSLEQGKILAIEETQPPSGRLWEKPSAIGIAEIPATAKTTRTANIKNNDFLLDTQALYNFLQKNQSPDGTVGGLVLILKNKMIVF